MNKPAVVILFLAVFYPGIICLSQEKPDSTMTLRIETNDGNIFIGSVVSEDSLAMVLQTESLGEIRIPQNSIKTRTLLTQVVKVGNDIWLPNPQSSRYFWAPNGYGPEHLDSV
jgi:hypothetical protein